MLHDIYVKGAKENNLKNLDIRIPKNKFVVMTGLSGSGKSSLAFDTIYKEGQRRYVESLSAYARQFLGNMEKPNVESIEGLSPAISIDQKTTSKNPRSTVGTVTEIYDYLRLLFARIGTPICPTHGVEITGQSIEEMTDKVLEYNEGRVIILAPLVKERKGTHVKTLDQLRKEGYVRARVNGEVYDLDDDINLEKNKRHTIEVVVDRLRLKEGVRSRLFDSLETAAKKGEGKVLVLINDEEHVFSEHYACPHCDFSIGDLEPRLFSFNAPYGACPTCHGLGHSRKIDPDLLIPDKTISIEDGAIKGWQNTDTYGFSMIRQVAKHYGVDLNQPVKAMKQKELDLFLYGTKERIHFKFGGNGRGGYRHENVAKYEGVINNLERRYIETTSRFMREWIENYMAEVPCPTCQGKKLNDKALSVKIGQRDIIEVTDMAVKEIIQFFQQLTLSDKDQKISEMALKEVIERLSFLDNVGLNYLTLSRQAATLSGGESQRIRLATQIGSQLTGVLYVLDEPSIGLHQRDNHKLITTLKKMRDLGNTLLVVEHDEETMYEADQIIDIGPGAGIYGGEVTFQGTVEEILKDTKSITGKYLSKQLQIDVPQTRRSHERGYIELLGARQNNLKNIDVQIPKGVLNVITGVSGSGKSSLVNECLYKGLHNIIYRKKIPQGDFDAIKNIDQFEKIINIDQSPIGRTPRSNPATYTKVFDDIRDIFAMTNEAKMRGYKKGRFSFNVKGGRCETCSGDGLIKIEMHFLPDVYVPCEVCNGKRYNSETLEVKYKGKNISDVLDMTIEESVEFFKNIPKAKRKLETLNNVGLGYLKLGQPATTLSGGEAQRVKLAKELHKRITENTLYILDEPTTGLHADDVKRLLQVIQHIVDMGATVVIIEHNLDVIKVADHIIDLGPEGGDMGGEVIATGTPEEVAANPQSYTGEYLKKVLR
ncbi:excinuclease ABC subunit UvrA [Candidatus Xianfuyuplasma coldseepsis]|uniref:UvrABC system protein A n=1 Tax=Candidatus Xianfuyuplasma coldseepsis TaxID=2782163 RepID=A0A7L7KQ09_9MOLU|nr:excinuclease ABC subunit UvrA [Xianfuyuplasma coldseepsis]QMS84881.1 excinuclease ABC subunit UvrA [Xianfuyuplasma coldseepsis]